MPILHRLLRSIPTPFIEAPVLHLVCACLQACENVGLDQDQLIVTGKGGDLVYGSAEAVESGEW